MRKTKEARPHVASFDDPFERLSEHILHHILTLLRSNKEAARTSVVSRSWHRAWSSYPIFDFNFSDFIPMDHWVPSSPNELRRVNDRFLDFVDRAMSRLREYRVAIPRLRVCATLVKINRSRALFDKWIGMALDSGAQELDLDFSELVPGSGPQRHSYSVPARVFTSGSITTMTLVGRELLTPLDSISTVNLSSLQSLKFSEIPLDELMLQKLLRGCPLLEELKLVCCKLLTQVVILCPNNLRRIVLEGHGNRVEIEAPRLEELECENYGLVLPQNHLILLDRSPRVKHLKLRNSPITQDRFQELLSKFPLLESLAIGFCKNLEKLVILNPLLGKIEIEGCEGLVDIEIGSANLSCFRYGTTEMQLPFIGMQNPTAVSVCEAKFESDLISILEPNRFIQLRDFLTRSCQFRSPRFELSDWQENGYVLDACDPLPYNVDRLDLLVCTMPRSSYAAILNMLLSLSHPTTLQVNSYGGCCVFLKFVCEKLENRGGDDADCCCCSGSGHRRCWLHELKDVEIVRVTAHNDHIRGPLDWRTVHELLPKFNWINNVQFRLHWK